MTPMKRFAFNLIIALLTLSIGVSTYQTVTQMPDYNAIVDYLLSNDLQPLHLHAPQQKPSRGRALIKDANGNHHCEDF